MTAAAARDTRYPKDGSWPALMRADMAAAYLDEPDREAFLRKVRDGIYPAPIKMRGCRDRWRKQDLDDTVSGAKPSVSLDDDL